MGQQFGSPYGEMPIRKTSGAAIASLILGIFGCIPFATSLLAIILGIVGIKKTSNPQYTGRGLAITGLILGLLGIAGWSLFGGTLYWAFIKGKQLAQDEAKPFIQAVVDGDYDKAGTHSSMTKEEMTALHDQLASFGAINDVSVHGIDAQKNASQPGRVTLKMTGNFAKAGSKDMLVEFDTRESGKLKITKVDVK
jgi:hypothetical protein